MEASGGLQEDGGSVGGRTFVMGTAIRVSRPPALARTHAASSNFSTSSTGVRRKEDKRKAKRRTVGRQEGTTLPFLPFAFQGAAMLGNWTSHPQRDQTRIVSSLINSGTQLLCVLIYLHTIPVSRGSADRIGSQERAGGRGALRAGFHPPSVALNR